MSIYLTKNENGQTHHFRATVQGNGVEVVHGVFYQWLHKHWHEYENHQAAHAQQEQMVRAKMSEGFIRTTWEPLPENTVDVYDNAKWHYEGDFPDDLKEYQGYVHTGMFVGWLIENDMMSEKFKNEFADEIEGFKKQQYTGTQIYQTCCGGVLMLEDLSERGNRFALAYFNLEAGEYLGDYEAMLGILRPTIYHVADTWDNYELMKQVIDKRFSEWQEQG
jgi:hypothetical protein